MFQSSFQNRDHKKFAFLPHEVKVPEKLQNNIVSQLMLINFKFWKCKNLADVVISKKNGKISIRIGRGYDIVTLQKYKRELTL